MMGEDSGYRRLELLERLFVGEVHLAELVGVEGFSKPVRIWKLRPELFPSPALRQMLTEDLTRAGRLSSYSVGQILDVWERAGSIAMTTEHVGGLSLRAVCEQATVGGRPLPENAALAIALEVTRAFEDAHASHALSDAVLHGDLRPEHVLLGWEGNVKVTGFGFARFLPAACPDGAWCRWEGRCYQPPERLHGEPATAASDLFSIGAILAETLTAGKERALGTVTDVVARISQPGVLADDIGAVLAKACSADPEARHGSASELAADLQAVMLERGEARSSTTLIRAALSDIAPPEQAEPPTLRDPQGGLVPSAGAAGPARPGPELEAPTLRMSAQDFAFFGRKDVLRAVARAMAETRRGTGRALFIRGRPGMGCTSTLQEIGQRLSDGSGNLLWLSIACARAERETQHAAVLRLIAATAGLAVDQDLRVLIEQERRLRALGVGPREIDALRLALGEPVERVSAAQVTGLLIDAAIHGLSSLCWEKTTIIAWDDLQWADDASIGGLYEVLSRLGSMPVLVILTAPHDFELPWSLPSGSVEIELGPLSREELGELALFAMGRGQFVSPPLLDAFEAQCDGNPTLLLETVDLMRERDELEVIDGGLVRRGGQPGPLPVLEDAIRRRLSRLEDETRAVAVTAAAAGPALSVATISGASGLPPEVVARHLEILSDEQGVLLRRSSGFDFRRPSIRRAVLATAKPALLDGIKRAIAHALLVPDGPQRIGQHDHAAALLEDVGDLADAAQVLEDVASRQAAAGDYRGATGRRVRALELMRASGQLTAAAEAKLCMAVGRSAIHSLALEDGEAPLRRAIELAAQLDDPRAGAEARLLLCRLLMRAGQTQDAIALTQDAMPLAERSADAAIVAQVCLAIAESCQQWGEYAPAVPYIERAMQLASEVGDLEVLGHALQLAVMDAIGVGDAERTEELLTRARAIADANGDPLLICQLHKAEALTLAFSGDHERSLKVNQEGIALAHLHGLEELELVMLHNSGDNHLELDHPREALYYYGESLRRARAARFDRLTEINGMYVGFVEATHFGIDAGLERLRAAMADAQRVGRIWNLTQGHQLLGRALFQRGDRSGAISNLEEALRLAHETGVKFFIDEAARWLDLVR